MSIRSCAVALAAVVCGLSPQRSVSAVGSTRAIVTRHDRPQEAFLELAKRFPQTATVKSAAARGPGDAGTLIDPRWVLTAAHVAASLKVGDVAAIRGETFRIHRIVRHPEWRTDADFRFDLALLELDRAVTAVAPAKVYAAADELGRILTFVGRGGNGTGLTGPTAEDGQLRGATNRVEEASRGLLRFRFDEPESPGTTDLEGISGPGDSGGPAYLVVGDTTFVLGVSSAQDTRPTGRQHGRYGVLEYYVRVSEYAGWIRSTLAGNAQQAGSRPWPAVRARHHMVYDPVAQQVMLFGGASSDTSIWVWKDGTWRSFPSAPPAGSNDAMAYDARRDRFVLHGGSERPDETWEWDRRAWRKLNVVGPGARGHHGLLYDPVRRVVALFGNNDDTPTSDTWGWDGERWTLLASEGPPARGVFGSAFDAKRGVWVIFGGCCARGVGILGDTWEWNGRRWSRIATDSAPSARYDVSMAYDPRRGRVVLFGGQDRTAEFSDTWEYDGKTWRQLDVAGPSARSGHALVYDPSAQAILLFGGRHQRDRLNDFWKLDAGWTQIPRP